MDKSFRIKANIGSDQVINVKLSQDIDLYEILSLQLKQKNMYKKHSADYGVIVGRVLANDAFGIPNVKVSVFIPLSGEDALRNDLRTIYPYRSVTDLNDNKKRFNTLPNYKKSSCHVPVGSFPKKQLVLDNDSVLEIFDKYYRYTTVTNKSGDYMIFGVPTGHHVIHVDVDLSDIGVLSQKPRDFVYKGYSIDLFNSPTQFRDGTNLDTLPQIMSQNVSVNVYPFWGDRDTNEIAITRKDINLQYKFETTCVFMGSVMTDNGTNAIGHTCVPDEKVGDASQLVPSEGTIEMIRKTGDDRVEEFAIKGNRLIDANGVFCYQIPMNLDYVGMDEKGNIVPTDNPNKGIPTRARVRFRFTLNENGEESNTRHKARYLVPNNPDLYENEDKYSERPQISSGFCYENSDYYEFGTKTPDECYRDLYWNKVYSVKSYVPRVQKSEYEKTSNYLAIKGVNKKDALNNNIIPFNKINLNFTVPAYHMVASVGRGSKYISGFWNYLRTKYPAYNIDAVREEVLDEMDAVGLDFYNDWLNGCLYFPAWFWFIRLKEKYGKGESAYNSQFCECEAEAGLEPSEKDPLYLYNNCSLVYTNNDLVLNESEDYKPHFGMYHKMNFGSVGFVGGLIKKMRNKDGGEIFYYPHGSVASTTSVSKDENPVTAADEKNLSKNKLYNYVRLFATDIILLGSLDECDLDGVPQMSYNLPSTTANIPPMGTYKPDDESDMPDEVKESRPAFTNESYKELESKFRGFNGMHWGYYWKYDYTNISRYAWAFMGGGSRSTSYHYDYNLGSGLFFGIACHTTYKGADWLSIGIRVLSNVFGLGRLWGSLRKTKVEIRTDYIPFTDYKTCVNVERLCELGVTLDADYEIKMKDESGSTYMLTSKMDGLITKREIADMDSRALFATLNSNKLNGIVSNPNTGYKKYKIDFFYPTDFDGRLEKYAKSYTSDMSEDNRSLDYLDFRFGSKKASNVSFTNNGSSTSINSASGDGVVGKKNFDSKTTYYISDDGTISFNTVYSNKTRHFYGTVDAANNSYHAFPLYDNSFYFFFGLNNGSTAIDKLYSDFFAYCPETRTLPFNIKVTGNSIDACRATGTAAPGEITISVSEIDKPYSIEILKDNEVVTYISSETANVKKISGLIYGRYNVRITDAYGNVIEETVDIKQINVEVDCSVSRSIKTEFNGQDCNFICSDSTNYYGQIVFNSYKTSDEKTVPITSIGSLSYTDNAAYFELGGETNRVRIYIREESGEDIKNYLCSCNKIVDGNRINIYRPGSFEITIYQLCYKGSNSYEEANNFSSKKLFVSDTKRLELLINSVPLKMLVGNNEDDISKYNPQFHNGNTVTSVNNVMGWLGVHNPTSYADIFQNPLGSEQNKTTWRKYVPSLDDKATLLKTRFEYMFNLSKAAYVTTTNDSVGNVFNVSYEANDGGFIRAINAYPQYDTFRYDNTERESEFNTYKTTSDELPVKCHNASPNIISGNYVYVKNENSVISPNGFMLSDIELYDFNKKYNDSTHKAGNYHAVFSQGANISSECERTSDGMYQVTPYQANDLFKDGFCSENYNTNKIYNNVFEKNPSATELYASGTYPYFRTEFVDRRLDYDLMIITPFETKNENTWSMGRISGRTFNGVEMAYDDSHNIISTSDLLEYKYNASDAKITLNDNTKKFYSSTLEYGSGKQIDLVNAYRYDKRTAPYAKYNNGNDEKALKFINVTSLTDKYKNFGTWNGAIRTYPSIRELNFHDIPYGDYYKFTNIDCSYNGIAVTATENLIKAEIKPGNETTFKVETKSGVNIQNGSTSAMISNGKYNVLFENDSVGSVTYKSKKLKSLPLSLSLEGSVGYKSKIVNDNGRFGVTLVGDTIQHDTMKAIKTYTGNTLLTTSTCVTNNILDSLTANANYTEYYDDVPDFKSTKFGLSKEVNLGNYQTLFLIYDRQYYNSTPDSLYKNIRVVNMSTVYDVSDFDFEYKYNGFVKKEDANDWLNSDDTGGSETEGGSEEEGGTSTPAKAPAAATSPDEGVDWLSFSLRNNQNLMENISNVTIKITYDGDTDDFTLDKGIKTEDNGSERVFSLIFGAGNAKPIGGGDGRVAKVDVYITLKNSLIYYLTLCINNKKEVTCPE